MMMPSKTFSPQCADHNQDVRVAGVKQVTLRQLEGGTAAAYLLRQRELGRAAST
jgi:hypothetical protein